MQPRIERRQNAAARHSKHTAASTTSTKRETATAIASAQPASPTTRVLASACHMEGSAATAARGSQCAILSAWRTCAVRPLARWNEAHVHGVGRCGVATHYRCRVVEKLRKNASRSEWLVHIALCGVEACAHHRGTHRPLGLDDSTHRRCVPNISAASLSAHAPWTRATGYGPS